MVLIANHFDVFEGESIDGCHIRVEFEDRQRHWFSTDLQVCLVEVVAVEVSVAKGVDKGPGFKPTDLCHHVGQ